MANHTNPNRNNANKFDLIDKTEKNYNRYVLACHNAGLIKLPNGRLKALLKVINGNKFINKKPVVATNGAETTAKGVGIITSGQSHSPLNEQAKASKRARILPFLAETARQIVHFENGPEVANSFDKNGLPKLNYALSAYMITLTVPNTSLVQFKKVYSRLSQNAKRLNDGFKNANRGNGTLRLVDKHGKPVHYFGDVENFETTVNPNALKKQDEHNLMHPHIHMVALFGAPLDNHAVTISRNDVPNLYEQKYTMGYSASVIFKYWATHFSEYKMSAQAFDLERTYTNESEAMIHDPRFSRGKTLNSGIIESNKYANKPITFRYLSKLVDDEIYNKKVTFNKRVFAAIYNATHGRTLHRSHGVFNRAHNFISTLKRANLLNACLASYYKDSRDNLDYVPDVISKINVLKNGEYSDSIKMNDDQMLYFNRSLLENSCIDEKFFNKLSFPDNDKGRLYRFLFNNLKGKGYGSSNILDRLDRWGLVLKHRTKLVKIKVNLLKKSPNAETKEVKKEINAAEQALNAFVASSDDLNSLKNAFLKKVDSDNGFKLGNDYSKIAKFYNVIISMRNIDKSGQFWENAEKSNTITPAEKKLVRAFGDFVVAGYDGKMNNSSCFIDDEFIQIYKNCEPLDDDELFNLLFDSGSNLMSTSFDLEAIEKSLNAAQILKFVNEKYKVSDDKNMVNCDFDDNKIKFVQKIIDEDTGLNDNSDSQNDDFYRQLNGKFA